MSWPFRVASILPPAFRRRAVGGLFAARRPRRDRSGCKRVRVTLKIDTSVLPGCTVLILSGRMEASHIAQLKELIDLQRPSQRTVMDLKDVKLADRDAVRFLGACEDAGVSLRHCPAFIREWIAREEAEGGEQNDE
jgi:hypothetical protein